MKESIYGEKVSVLEIPYAVGNGIECVRISPLSGYSAAVTGEMKSGKNLRIGDSLCTHRQHRSRFASVVGCCCARTVQE
jgi:hypothetical protein